MKIFLRRRLDNQASILFVTMVISAVVGLTLGGYLTLTAGQQSSVARSQRWNAALDLAEAGIEEGLAQVNSSPDDFSANTWGVTSGTNFGPQLRTLAAGKYGVIVQGTNAPIVYATGMISAPISGTVFKRIVRVTTQVLPRFNVALGAVNDIDMNGNGMATDSWNSHSTNLSVNGQYDPSRTSTNGDVASQQGIVNIGNHTIDGNLYLGPTATYVSNTNNILGDLDKNYNVNFPDVKLPAAFATALPAETIGTGSKTTNYIHSDGYFIVNNNYPIVINTNVNAKIEITANFDNSITLWGGMTNSPTVAIYDNPPANGSLTISGNGTGGAVNGTPLNFLVYGLPTMTSITLSGTSSFIGAIYAPEASLTLNGGGNSNNLMGAAIVKTVTLNGHYDFHYDEALADWGPAKSFTANSWQELSVAGNFL